MSSRVRESLRALLSSIREELREGYLDEKAVHLGQHTLLIGTGSVRQVTHLIELIHKLSPGTAIHCVARPSLISQVKPSLKGSDSIHAYEDDGFFHTKGILESIPPSIIESLESVIGVLNNVWGAGYENIYTILDELEINRCYTFNVEERFSEVTPTSAKRRIENLTLNKALSDWYWENGIKADHDN